MQGQQIHEGQQIYRLQGKETQRAQNTGLVSVTATALSQI